ncbi:MAG: helix-turn-helix transcriptional regulator [Armatimonadetes bacterium]|nr:helix-turn-helix transcriptional regulator [Armatimonadota bacterium]
MPTTLVLNADQVAAMASPTRGIVYERLASHVEAVAADLAAETGISAATALYHLRQLVNVGLVVEVGERSTGKRPATVFRPAHRQLALPSGEEHADVRLQAMLSSLRKCKRNLEASRGKGTHILKIATRLTPDDMATFLQKLEDAADFAKSHMVREGQEVSWLSIACPPSRSKRVQ